MSQDRALSPSELLAKYQRLRNVARALNNKIMSLATRSALQWAGSELGICRGKTFVLDTEDEMSVVMDCCFFDYVRDGKTVVQQYFAQSKKRLNPDEITVLRAMMAARFSVYSVVDATRGVGVTLHDALRNDRVFVVDIGLSKSAPEGALLAGRLISPDGLTMTTGGVQPVTAGAVDEIGEIIDATFPDGATDLSKLSSSQRSRFNVSVIRACLRNGSSAKVRYAEPDKLGSPAPRSSLPRERDVDLFLGGQVTKPGVVRSFFGSLLPRRRLW